MTEMKDVEDASEIALIVGGGPGVSASCARRFTDAGMRVVVAARNPNKPVLRELAEATGVTLCACDASDAEDVDRLFENIKAQHGTPKLVIHNIDGRSREIFGKSLIEAEPEVVRRTIENGAFSAFLVARAAARQMLEGAAPPNGVRGTVIFTNASAAMKGFARSGAFAMACHAKAGLAQSIARELMPQGVHVAHVPIDAAVGWTQEDGSRRHRRAGTDLHDNLADPDHIAETYLQLHHQHRST